MLRAVQNPHVWPFEAEIQPWKLLFSRQTGSLSVREMDSDHHGISGGRGTLPVAVLRSCLVCSNCVLCRPVVFAPSPRYPLAHGSDAEVSTEEQISHRGSGNVNVPVTRATESWIPGGAGISLAAGF